MFIVIANGLGVSENEGIAKKLADRLGKPYKILPWQGLVEKESDVLLAKHTTYGGPSARLGKKLLYEYAFDETSYDDTKEKIQLQLSAILDVVFDEEIVFIGHSMGTIILYDYLKEIGDSRVRTFITTGCPLPLIKKEKYTDLPAIKWVNYWEDSDPVAHKLFRKFIVDEEFENYNFWKGWNWLSHLGYFKSRKLASKIEKVLNDAS